MNIKNNQKNIYANNINIEDKSSSKMECPVKSFLFGVGITNETEKNILEYIVKIIENSRENFYIVTPNPEMIILSQKNKDFNLALNQAKLALCDGAGISLAGKVLSKPFKERITGVNFVESLCERVSKQPITVGFLGGGPSVAERASKCLNVKFPDLKTVFAAEEWGSKASSKSQISQKQIDILFVAFGAPKQEFWMRDHLNKIPVRVMMGVGGSLDYFSGNVRRAPKLVRFLGFEWLYRLVRQPWRWKRQLALIEFARLLLKTKFFG